ncbi:MAG: UDP-N-acetylglucosamine 2-epimerase (non-hydrolyzing) [Burkholderiaceae bacterium]
MKRILTVVGARPQFIKAAAVSRAIRTVYAGRVEEAIIHTGQHHDENMSDVFFEEMEIPRPACNLQIAGGGHGAMTGRMLAALEIEIQQRKPDCLLIYGDTNSTLAGALAAAKLHVPVAHVEAGLRSFNMRMPEEINRILSDRISTYLFCPTPTAVRNLAAEGITDGVFEVGDVMYDVALHFRELARTRSGALERLGVRDGGFVLATCHRAENTDDPHRLAQILSALGELAADRPLVLPLHPRTRKLVGERGLNDALSRVIVTEPLSFLDMVALEQAAAVIVTDSGGVQKEAYFYEVPCVTMRDETEWVETVDLGWNQVVGADRERIVRAVAQAAPGRRDQSPYGDGRASARIIEALL